MPWSSVAGFRSMVRRRLTSAAAADRGRTARPKISPAHASSVAIRRARVRMGDSVASPIRAVVQPALIPQEHGPVDDHEAYGTLNMGAGYALLVAPAVANRVVAIAASHSIPAWIAGHVERTTGSTKVVILPKSLEYPIKSLNIR